MQNLIADRFARHEVNRINILLGIAIATFLVALVGALAGCVATTAKLEVTTTPCPQVCSCREKEAACLPP